MGTVPLCLAYLTGYNEPKRNIVILEVTICCALTVYLTLNKIRFHLFIWAKKLARYHSHFSEEETGK